MPSSGTSTVSLSPALSMGIATAVARAYLATLVSDSNTT